jgi:hypothetical protein
LRPEGPETVVRRVERGQPDIDENTVEGQSGTRNQHCLWKNILGYEGPLRNATNRIYVQKYRIAIDCNGLPGYRFFEFEGVFNNKDIEEVIL